MPKYCITKYDYTIKRNQIISWYTDVFTALNNLYIYVFIYLQEQDGYKKMEDVENLNKFMFNRNKFRSALKISLPPGHYIIRDPGDHIYKLEIWQKSVVNGHGWIYKTYSKDQWRKIFDIDIIELSDNILIEFNEAIPHDDENARNHITKDNIELASKVWKQLNNSLIKLESFKKIRESYEISTEHESRKLSYLMNEIPNEFTKFKKKMTNGIILSESTIFEVNSGGYTNCYKAMDDKKIKKIGKDYKNYKDYDDYRVAS